MALVVAAEVVVEGTGGGGLGSERKSRLENIGAGGFHSFAERLT